MGFIETPAFTSKLPELLSDDDFRLLQQALASKPDLGPKIPGTRGIRKLRWPARGKGKRGGARVIYYWFNARDRILLLYLYSKNERDDLTAAQLRILRLVEEDYR